MPVTDVYLVAPAMHRKVLKLMGNRFELTVVDEDAVRAATLIEAAIEEIRRIEKLLTTFSDDSQTNLINRNAGMAPVRVDKEVFSLVQRSIRISALTQGAFDPKTGLPVSGIKSVTIICPNAEIADAMATPVMIMGVKVGLNMINQLQNMACVIIDDNNRIFTSTNINLQ